MKDLLARKSWSPYVGDGISGALQLAVSSWVFVLVAFGVGIVTAFTMYGNAGGPMFDSPDKLARGFVSTTTNFWAIALRTLLPLPIYLATV